MTGSSSRPPPGPVEQSGARPAPEVVQDAAATFALLSATVRLELVWHLAGGERDVGTLADVLGESVATVSHHLGKLKLAGLVTARRAGKHQIYAVADPHVVELVREAIAHHHDQHDGEHQERRRIVPRRDRRGA